MAESESGRFAAIILAAGLGSRFGGGKLLAQFRARPLIAGAVESALAAPVGLVVIALGDDPDLEAAILDIGADRSMKLARVADPARGMGASLAAAAQAVPPDIDGVFVFLGDMPLVGSEIAPALIRALAGREGIAAPVHAGQRGHPVLFGGHWIPALRDLDGDIGAQALIRQAGERFVAVETDDAGVLLDIDRPEDIGLAQSV